MEAKLKAKELVERFKPVSSGTVTLKTMKEYRSRNPERQKFRFREYADYAHLYHAKQCALMAVDEVLNNMNIIREENNYNYWQQVKSEITNL